MYKLTCMPRTTVTSCQTTLNILNIPNILTTDHTMYCKIYSWPVWFLATFHRSRHFPLLPTLYASYYLANVTNPDGYKGGSHTEWSVKNEKSGEPLMHPNRQLQVALKSMQKKTIGSSSADVPAWLRYFNSILHSSSIVLVDSCSRLPTPLLLFPRYFPVDPHTIR